MKLLPVLFFLLTLPLAGQDDLDTIYLKNGTKVAVTVISQEKDFVQFERDGQKSKVDASQIEDLYITNRFTPDNLVLVVDVPGKKMDDLFGSGKEWLFRTYKSGKVVLDYDDKENGKILGSASTQTVYYINLIKKDAGYFKYRIELGFKDGKARIKIDDIYYVKGEMLLGEGASFFVDYPDNWPKIGIKKNKKEWDSMRSQAMEEFRYIMHSFEEEIKVTDGDDW